MLVLEGRNVNDLYFVGVNTLKNRGERRTSRNGDVLVLDTPVMSVYHRPWERVLIDPKRDANPFFHLFESLWMLAGRNDAAFLNRFVKDFGSRFAEEDGHLHGAYGRRWRDFINGAISYHVPHWSEPLDQIEYCVEALKNNPDDRRVVISMWDPMIDLGSTAKDLPCNTHIYLRIVNRTLDLTVMCRSNDIVWGAYGANAVHFSVLQEVIAAGIGVDIGKMYQFSNNWHGYVDVMEKQEAVHRVNFYDYPDICPLPMVTDYESFLPECGTFCSGGKDEPWRNKFFPVMALPMEAVHQIYREHGATEALRSVHNIGAPDWREACRAWLERRVR